MSKKALVPINLLSFSAAPTIPTPESGDCYWDTTLSALRVYNGTAWVNANTTSGGGVSYYTQAASATLLVLTSSSARNINITANALLEQAIQLPNASTMTLGDAFYITNNSDTFLQIQTADTLQYMTIRVTQTLKFTCILASGTTSASWQVDFISGRINDYLQGPIIQRIDGVNTEFGSNRLWDAILDGDIYIGRNLETAGNLIEIGSNLLSLYRHGAITTEFAYGGTPSPKSIIIGEGNDVQPTTINIGSTLGGTTTTTIYGTTTIGSSATKTTAYPVEPTGTTTGTVTQSAQLAGYLGMPQNPETATGVFSYTLTASDAGKHIYYTGTPTSAALVIPANTAVAFEIGTTIVIMNDHGNTVPISISITTNTLQLAGTGATGTRTLARFGVASIVKVTATKWIISGNGLT
jgi:hypothetical protein